MGKIILTIVITVIMILFAIGYFGTAVYLSLESGTWILPAIILLVALGIGGVIIYNMMERIKEIKGGNEDDLSKY